MRLTSLVHPCWRPSASIAINVIVYGYDQVLIQGTVIYGNSLSKVTHASLPDSCLFVFVCWFESR
jgi:hypothetical protein